MLMVASFYTTTLLIFSFGIKKFTIIVMKQNDVIYQIFPRNYSLEGTFRKIEEDLPRIQSLGVDIVYLMPINEIGIKNRKGTCGSPYASKDYFSISSDLGTIDDLKSLIQKVHKLGMKIIVDMVFNHTSPDNVLLNEHEDYYYHRDGKLSNRVGDWSDIIDLDTYKQETQNYLLSVLRYWINVGFDGFRFDVASMIPLDFFKRARKELGDNIFFIGESISKEFAKYLLSIGDYSTPDDDMYPTFDSLYNYNYFRALSNYILGKEQLSTIVDELNKDKRNQRLICLENHDNKRISSMLDKDKLKDYLDFISFIKGQLFIYAGQEYGNRHKPELFEKDPVDFSYQDLDILEMYKEAIDKKHHQKEIVDMDFVQTGENSIKVKVTYFDNTEEVKEFILLPK